MQSVKGVVLTVYKQYLDMLVERSDDLTTMIYGWQANPYRMKTPAEILKKEQSHIPFLFSEDRQDSKKVTHLAVCGWMEHSEDIENNNELMDWLRERRIERFCNAPYSDDVKTFYLVTATTTVTNAAPPMNVIPYKNLKLDSTSARLSEKKTKGYSMVEMPDYLIDWYEKACEKWDALEVRLPVPAE